MVRFFVLTAVVLCLLVADVEAKQATIARGWPGEQIRHWVVRKARVTADFFSPKNLRSLIVAVGVGAVMSYVLINSLVWEDHSDTAIANRITRLQLQGETRADRVVRFLLPGGDTALGEIVARNHLNHVNVMPHNVHHRWLLPYAPPLDKPLLQVSPAPLKINIHTVEGKLIPSHLDFGKRAAVIVDDTIIGLHDRYYRNDWLWGTETYVKDEPATVALLYGTVFAVFNDGYYGVLVSQLRDSTGKFFSLAEDTIVFCTRANLYFETQGQKTLNRLRSMRYRGKW